MCCVCKRRWDDANQNTILLILSTSFERPQCEVSNFDGGFARGYPQYVLISPLSFSSRRVYFLVKMSYHLQIIRLLFILFLTHSHWELLFPRDKKRMSKNSIQSRYFIPRCRLNRKEKEPKTFRPDWYRKRHQRALYRASIAFYCHFPLVFLLIHLLSELPSTMSLPSKKVRSNEQSSSESAEVMLESPCWIACW